MKKISSAFLPVILFIVFITTNTSCKKDVANNNAAATDTTHTGNNNNNNSSLTPVLLTKIYGVDTTLAAPGDTLFRISISYDASNRLQIFTKLELDRVTGGNYQFDSTNYAYTGTDTFAYRSIRYRHYFTSPGTDTYHDTTYYHFVNGHYASDSTMQSGYRLEVNRYNYNSGLTGFAADYYSLPGLLHQSHGSDNLILQTFTNGDLSHQLDTTRYDGLTSPGNYYFERYERTIDHTGNPNPMYKVALATFCDYLHEDDERFGGNYEPPHLISQDIGSSKSWDQNNTVTGMHDSQENFTYEFRADGYPSVGRLIVTYSDIASPPVTNYYKLIYQYNQ